MYLRLKQIEFPVSSPESLKNLKAGDEVLLSGVIYTARDRVHRLVAEGRAEWPFELKNNAVYYCGPTPASEGFPMGSCGPTTSARMDKWTAGLYFRGLAATIGKGPRNEVVRRSIKDAGAVYFSAFGGCGALYGSRVLKASVIAFDDLGPQAVYRAEIKNFPVVVGIDPSGNNIFENLKF